MNDNTHRNSNTGDLHRTYREIAEAADKALPDGTLGNEIRNEFGSQKSFGEFLGVGESTIAGWMKNRSFPDYAIRAFYSARVAIEMARKNEEAQNRSSDPKVVKRDNYFELIELSVDDIGEETGALIASRIPTIEIARKLSSADLAWRLLNEAADLLHSLYEFERHEIVEDFLQRMNEAELHVFDPDKIKNRQNKLDKRLKEYVQKFPAEEIFNSDEE